MAFADWDRYSGNVSNVAVDFELFSGQNWGAPILHSALANPLSGVGEGTYLRRFALDGMNASRAGVIFSSIGAGVKAGAFVGPDETRAQEARAWMRYSDLGGDPDGGVAIGGRWRHVVTSTSSVSRWGAPDDFRSINVRGNPKAVDIRPERGLDIVKNRDAVEPFRGNEGFEAGGGWPV